MSSKSDVFQNMKQMGSKAFPVQDPIPNQDFARENLAAFQKILHARRSIRIYTGERIPEATMRDILADATLAPSSSNLQSYQLYWVKDREKKDAVATACLGQPAATTAGELVVVVARQDLWRQNLDALLQQMTQDGQALPPSVKFYYEKLVPKVMATDPLGLLNAGRRMFYFLKGLTGPTVRTPVSTGDHRIFGHTQAALAAQTLMLSFTAHGYDSCPMGGMDAVRIRKILHLPRRAEVAMVISAGTRKPEGLYGPRHRLPLSQLIQEI